MCIVSNMYTHTHVLLSAFRSFLHSRKHLKFIAPHLLNSEWLHNYGKSEVFPQNQNPTCIQLLPWAPLAFGTALTNTLHWRSSKLVTTSLPLWFINTLLLCKPIAAPAAANARFPVPMVTFTDFRLVCLVYCSVLWCVCKGHWQYNHPRVCPYLE